MPEKAVSRSDSAVDVTPDLAQAHPMGYIAPMQTVAETPTFSRQTSKLLTAEERHAVATLAASIKAAARSKQS